MLNIHDLEKRWKIYKIKSFMPYIIGIGSLTLIILITYFFSTNSKKSTLPKKQIIEKKSVTVPVISKKEKNKPTVILPPKKAVSNKIPVQTQKLQPSMNFMKNIQHQTLQQPQRKQQSTIKKQHIIKKRKKIVQQKPPKENVQNLTTKIIPVKKEPKVTITIERKETKNDIFEVIKRFKKNNNPALSLFVAKKYYELGNYKQSYNYALITNQINPNIEASWLIFAKSLVKLHKKNKAIHTLQAYIKVSHSSNAEILLNEITSGKFQ